MVVAIRIFFAFCSTLQRLPFESSIVAFVRQKTRLRVLLASAMLSLASRLDGMYCSTVQYLGLPVATCTVPTVYW